MAMRALALCGAAMTLAFCLAPASSAAQTRAETAELVMVEEGWCPWCARWHEEIGGVYAKTAEGRRAPLRRIDIHGPALHGLGLSPRIHYTPTFVLMQRGAEVGRIEGYPGEDFFWPLLNQLLARLPAKAAPKP